MVGMFILGLAAPLAMTMYYLLTHRRERLGIVGATGLVPMHQSEDLEEERQKKKSSRVKHLDRRAQRYRKGHMKLSDESMADVVTVVLPEEVDYAEAEDGLGVDKE